MIDILKDGGDLFIGSRMKRLAERMQADAAEIVRDMGYDNLQTPFMAVFSALSQEDGLTVNGLVDRIGFSQPSMTRALKAMVQLDFVRLQRSDSDKRQKRAFLTELGQDVAFDLKVRVWPRIEHAAKQASLGLTGSLSEQIETLENAIAKTPLHKCQYGDPALEIVGWRPELATDFYKINEEWVSSMFVMEPTDYEILERPQELIIEDDGEIWFIKDPVAGIIGTAALLKHDDGEYELTKMGVTEAARGKKAGERLLAFVIDRARKKGAKSLFLLTNTKCEAAIHLYEKLGFYHDAVILADKAARYSRCNVAMSHPL